MGAIAASSISAVFDRLRAAGQMAFMPFITAGDPDLDFTARLIPTLADAGADLIEIGFPYSDPIADGPVIQASYQRALNQKLQVARIFECLSDVRSARPDLPPLVGMVAYSLIFRMGAERFLDHAARAGLAGLIVPDLPGDEAGDLATSCRPAGLNLVPLIAPTTTPARAEKIVQQAAGFLYCISVAGTTGVRDQLPPELRDQLRWLKARTQLPLAVGFGISRPEQVDELRGLADGVIVGSAIVRLVAAVSEQQSPPADALAQIAHLVRNMKAATSRSR